MSIWGTIFDGPAYIDEWPQLPRHIAYGVDLADSGMLDDYVRFIVGEIAEGDRRNEGTVVFDRAQARALGEMLLHWANPSYPSHGRAGGRTGEREEEEER